MENTPRDIKGSTVVITGASSGLGRGVALKLAEQGANVVLAARRTHVLEDLVSQIKSLGGNALAVTTDVSDLQNIAALAQNALDSFGRIDIWINNVGVGALGYFWEIPLDVHARVVEVNLIGLIYGAHFALKQFIKQKGGTLINVGSIDSEIPLALQNTYAATKAAVLSLSRSVNEELRLSGHNDYIKVATIMPWAVDTPWWTHAANYTGHAPRMMAMDDPELVVDAIIKACTVPKEEMPVGAKSHLFDWSHHIFPNLTEHLSANLSKSESEKALTAADTQGALFEPMLEGDTIDGGIRKRMELEDKLKKNHKN